MQSCFYKWRKINGNSMESTNPKDGDNDKKPILNDVTDSIIYEAHIRDLTKDELQE